MIRQLDDFVKGWDVERHSTHNLFIHMTDAALSQRIDAEGWTLVQIAWHITTSMADLMQKSGLPIAGVADDAPMPHSVAEIAATYECVAEELLQKVRNNWTDAQLLEQIAMYGNLWTRGEILSVLIAHQTHHRGQMTVLMRQAGLRVPGVCGPSREEMAELLKNAAK